MDGDRKYKQRGYGETSGGGSSSGNGSNGNNKPRTPQGPRPSIDITGPRLPRLVQTVTASRCYSCTTTLPTGIDFRGNCPKCNAALHCCKQCAHFESSTRFQCLKPVPVRLPYKDQVNECEMFSARVTVARDVSQQSSGGGGGGASLFALGSGGGGNGMNDRPRVSQDARAAFDNLFKK